MTSNLNKQNKLLYSLNFFLLSQNWISNTLKNSSLILCWVLPSQAQNELDHSSFQGRSIFIYIYTFIKPGQYLRFWNNFTRYLCCFTSSSDTPSHKKIWDLKTITEKNRNYFTPTSLEFFLTKTFFWEKCRNKLKNSCFEFSLPNQPQKELNKSSL